jgi:hypothetical protein
MTRRNVSWPLAGFLLIGLFSHERRAKRLKPREAQNPPNCLTLVKSQI